MDAKDATNSDPALEAVIPPNESRRERLQRLNEKAKRLTKDPGVYLMKDARGRVIYVGKSASMRDRVSSYFQPSTKLDAKKAGLLDEVVDFETLGADSEVEALLVENRLIKDIQPKFNARLLDDKTFPYLVVAMGDAYPGVYVTREPSQYKKAKVYGPFTSVWALKDAISLLQKAFKFRTCELNIQPDDEKRRFFRPCLLHAIKQCTAPCADRVSQDEYRGDVRRLLRVLDGDRVKLTKDLRKQMEQASSDMRFEEAAKLRDELKALQALGKRAGKGTAEFWQPESFHTSFVSDPAKAVDELQKALNMDAAPRVVECFDIAHLQGGEMVGSKVAFIDGQPFKDGYRRYRIRHQQGNNDFLSLQEVISRRYREAASGSELYPDLIVIDGGVGQLNGVMDVFQQAELKPPMVVSISKQEELIHTPDQKEPARLSRNHLGLKMLQYARDEAHRFAQHYHHILRRKAQLEEDVRQGKRPPKPRKKLAALKQLDPVEKVQSDLDRLQQELESTAAGRD
ncbi:MAG: excinuclease ABC subunit UvrC [Planctomycetota bacterium]